jgi:hypothetical protein
MSKLDKRHAVLLEILSSSASLSSDQAMGELTHQKFAPWLRNFSGKYASGLDVPLYLHPATGVDTPHVIGARFSSRHRESRYDSSLG